MVSSPHNNRKTSPTLTFPIPIRNPQRLLNLHLPRHPLTASLQNQGLFPAQPIPPFPLMSHPPSASLNPQSHNSSSPLSAHSHYTPPAPASVPHRYTPDRAVRNRRIPSKTHEDVRAKTCMELSIGWRRLEGDRGGGKLGSRGEERTYPRRVRQILMRKSAPQPAMRKTPRGGTGWRESC